MGALSAIVPDLMANKLRRWLLGYMKCSVALSTQSHLTTCYASRHKTGRVISAEGIGSVGHGFKPQLGGTWGAQFFCLNHTWTNNKMGALSAIDSQKMSTSF